MQVKVKIKTLKVSYNISSNDLEHKKKSMDKWLAKGMEVKVHMRMVGRSKYINLDAQDKLEKMFEEYRVINSHHKNFNHFLHIKNKK